MGVLLSIEKCLNSIPRDIMQENTLFIELDKENYDSLQEEVTYVTGKTNFKDVEQKVADFGSCLVMGYNDCKIIVALDKKSKRKDEFYVAFKTKVL